ncbi:hypothetical protein LC065_20165 (plasmid) [Halobacillus litoralis]|uniref:hypothetical protein n=1 Tax=Halobacillus litoralis TaxID=45668 RepID=UPI001CFF0127|nr:hypothetical protein [Halobacillus litoralis]WLR49561.1 hypothetical protein LC065_20165 [Halobacillus litoralis]
MKMIEQIEGQTDIFEMMIERPEKKFKRWDEVKVAKVESLSYQPTVEDEHYIKSLEGQKGTVQNVTQTKAGTYIYEVLFDNKSKGAGIFYGEDLTLND